MTEANVAFYISALFGCYSLGWIGGVQILVFKKWMEKI